MLESIPELKLRPNAPLSEYTRFGIGGPARVYVETASEASFIAAIQSLRAAGDPFVVIGDGTNLIVSDQGFAGVVLHFTAARIPRVSGRHPRVGRRSRLRQRWSIRKLDLQLRPASPLLRWQTGAGVLAR